LEAVVVLAITSMLMMLVFSIGTRTTESGFRLGRRALGLADVQLGLDTTRTMFQALSIPSPGPKPPPDLDGTEFTLTAWASLSRPTPCGGPGPVGLLRLTITRQADGESVLSCQTATTSANILDLGRSPAGFAYSQDGVNWSETVHMTGQVPAGGATAPASRQERRLLVRVATPDGRFQLSELLSSSPSAAAPADAPAQTGAAAQPGASAQPGAPALAGAPG
jgi:hypothetical protein